MTDERADTSRARLQLLVLLVFAFSVGVLAGAAGHRLLSTSRSAPPSPPGPGAERRLPGVLERMDLTPAQRTAVDSILASGWPRNEAIMSEVLPRLRAVGDSLHMGIRAVLTPTQAAEFDAYLRTHRPDRRPPPGGDVPPPLSGDQHQPSGGGR